MNVLIVESAAKGRTLKRYLGDGWDVVATGGHIETLPSDRQQHGREARKAFWANRPGELPTPPWVWTDRGARAVEKVLEAGGQEPVFWIATDPDREGEFIAWCLDRLLAPHGPTHRVTFQEVTREAVLAALDQPREVDQSKVDAALVRKYLDRLVGFRTSKLAASIVGRGASMGRVQTPALGFVVDRELEREAFVPTRYFEVRATAEEQEMRVRFYDRGDPDRWQDAQGKTSLVRTFDGDLARSALKALESGGEVELDSVVERRVAPRKPSPPFSTDALLQEAGSRLGWSPKKTSALASMLYEAGHITYIRTDSTRLAEQAVSAARDLVRKDFGDQYVGSGVQNDVASGPTQDAHEAIRPTSVELSEPDIDDDDARRLYRLVRARTLASQMASATSKSWSVEAICAGFGRPLTTTVTWRTFVGWEAAYREFEPDRPTAPPEAPLEVGAVWTLDPSRPDQPNPQLIEDETRPPGRYRAHTLVRLMKDAGIGRPSTYARTVEKLEERQYLTIEEGALAPTERGREVWLQAAPLYALDGEEEAIDELFSPDFTAVMEEGLDQIAAGDVRAPERWESWRDRIRELHEEAQKRRSEGVSTPRQRELLRRLLENAHTALPVETPEPLSDLSYREAQELVTRLRDAGVLPAPTEGQLAYLQKLLDDLQLSEAEADEIVGEEGIEGLQTADRASAVLDELKTLHDERRPASARQRRFIDALLEEMGVSPAEAASWVGVDSLDDLTGGPEGSASRLIDELKRRASGTE